MTAERPRPEARLLERMVTLSDAVIAIAITLLVLGIDVPTVSPGESLSRALDDIGPQAFAWALSFAVIALLWARHHVSTDRLLGADAILVVINFLFLAAISLLPFSSGLIGEYGEDSLATVIYAVNLALAGFTLLALELAADRRGLRRADIPALNVVASTIPFALFLLSIPVAFASTTLAQLMWMGALASGLIETALRRIVPGLGPPPDPRGRHGRAGGPASVDDDLQPDQRKGDDE